MNDRKKILDKIRKAMALSKSANEHEAAAALRQAHKLMELHGITNADIDAAEITDSLVRAGASVTPAEWEARVEGEHVKFRDPGSRSVTTDCDKNGTPPAHECGFEKKAKILQLGCEY